MSKARKVYVASFDAKYLTVWKTAVDKHVVFELPYNVAVKARQDLYKLRTAMHDEKHPLADYIKPLSITFDPSKAPENKLTKVTMTVGKKVGDSFLTHIESTLAEELAAQTQVMNELQETMQVLQVEQDTVDEATGEDKELDVDADYDDLFPFEGEEE